MNKNKGFIGIGLILAIVLGIVVVGGGAYYLGKSSDTKKEVNNSEINQNENLPVVDNSQQVNVANTTNPLVSTGCTSSSTPSIKVLSPNGGEIFTAGQQITVKWKSCNNPHNPKQVIVSLDDPAGFRYYLSGNHLDNVGTADTGILTTTLPNVGYVSTNSGSPINFKPGNNFTVMVSAWPQEYEPIWDFSDTPFTINSAIKNVTGKYVSYSGNAPFTFTYPSNFFQPDLYYTNDGSKGLSLMTIPNSDNDGCDMLSISTLEFNKIPVCTEETNRYTPGVMNYCKIVVGSLTKTTYKVNASTPQVCGKPASQEARNFVDHLVSELAKQ